MAKQVTDPAPAPGRVLASEFQSGLLLSSRPLPRPHSLWPFRPRLRVAAPPVERRSGHAHGVRRFLGRQTGADIARRQYRTSLTRSLIVASTALDRWPRLAAARAANLRGQVSYLYQDSFLAVVEKEDVPTWGSPRIDLTDSWRQPRC